MHYSWESEEAFDLWHNEVMSSLGIPHPNKNSETGELDQDATWTTAYTNLNISEDNVLYAKVEDEIAQQFSENLGTPYFYEFKFEI
jgi:hypothetical protein